MKKYFLFVTSDRFPNGDAGAVRTESMVKICQNIGYTPVVIGMGEYTSGKLINKNGFFYCSLRLKWNNIFDRILGRILFCFRAKRILVSYDPTDVAGIMTKVVDENFLKFLKKYSIKHSIPVVYDSVEWYSPSEFSNGERNWFYKKNDRLNRYYIQHPLRVVAISTFLHKHFSDNGISTVRIPVVLDVNAIPYSFDNSDISKIKIVYAGLPGYKDRLVELIAAYNELSDEEKSRIEIRVIGIERNTFVNTIWGNGNSAISESVVFEGRKSREYVLKAVRDSDFAFLLRPSEERYAKAGFPTKVAESCACGTAMLCNYSSDLDLYLKDGKNCVIISECSSEACRKALLKILDMDREQIKTLKQNARATAETYFSWDNYVGEIKTITQGE